MATINLTIENHKQITEENEIVILDFWAEWCGPCKMFGPAFEKVSEKHPDVVFAKCDTQQEQELGPAFRIRSIPTVMIMKQGKVVFNQSGVLPESALDDLIKQIKELNVNEIEEQAG